MFLWILVVIYYENIIFEDIKKSHKVQKELGIDHIFDEIYQESKDTEQLNKYRLKLSQFAITVLADKSLGDPMDPNVVRRKVDLISEVTVDPNYPFSFVE